MATPENSYLQGFEIAKRATLDFLEQFKENAEADDRELLRCVARTSLRTKLQERLADRLTDIVVEALLAIRKPGQMIDLFMVSSSTPHEAPLTCSNVMQSRGSQRLRTT